MPFLLTPEPLKILYLNCEHGQGCLFQKFCKLELLGLGQVQRRAQQISGVTSFWHRSGLSEPGNTKLVCLLQSILILFSRIQVTWHSTYSYLAYHRALQCQ